MPSVNLFALNWLSSSAPNSVIRVHSRSPVLSFLDGSVTKALLRRTAVQTAYKNPNTQIKTRFQTREKPFEKFWKQKQSRPVQRNTAKSEARVDSVTAACSGSSSLYNTPETQTDTIHGFFARGSMSRTPPPALPPLPVSVRAFCPYLGAVTALTQPGPSPWHIWSSVAEAQTPLLHHSTGHSRGSNRTATALMHFTQTPLASACSVSLVIYSCILVQPASIHRHSSPSQEQLRFVSSKATKSVSLPLVYRFHTLALPTCSLYPTTAWRTALVSAANCASGKPTPAHVRKAGADICLSLDSCLTGFHP